MSHNINNDVHMAITTMLKKKKMDHARGGRTLEIKKSAPIVPKYKTF